MGGTGGWEVEEEGPVLGSEVWGEWARVVGLRWGRGGGHWWVGGGGGASFRV